MADYGVPTDPEGALPWSWASTRLVANRNYWVVTVRSDGRPHAMPVWGVWSERTQRFWFSCSPTARKHGNLLQNPQVTVMISDTVEVVTVEGSAEFVAVGPNRAAAIATYGEKYSETEKRAELECFVAENATWCVTPRRAYAIIEREEEFGPRATRWSWDLAED